MASSSAVSPQDEDAGPVLVASETRSAAALTSSRLKLYLEWAWMAAIVSLMALHAVHLRADFPNYSPWMDYAKYTDEGWYGNAAIEALLRGSWYMPGDFNTAVALPVWPLLEWIVFHITGVSVFAARALVVAIFGGNLLLTYAVVQRSFAFLSDTDIRSQSANVNQPQRRWVPLLAATLVAASSFLYCFSRLAILEPLEIFFLLLSWYLALKLLASSGHARHLHEFTLGDGAGRSPRHAILLVAIGVVLCLMVLTKTTAVVLLPSTLYLVWRAYKGERGQAIRAGVTVLLAMALPGLLYYVLLVRPRYVADFKYLFAANVYQQPTTAYGWVMAFWYAIHGGVWMDHTLFAVGVVLLVLSLWMRGLWRNPLYVASVAALALQIFFIGYHNNMQPRYYTTSAFPLFISIALCAEALLKRHRLLGGVALAVIAVGAALNLRQTVGYALHPQYTFVNAATGLTRYIDQHPNGNRLLLSISGNEIGLITGLPAICDDFGTLELPLRIHQYQPGWYAAWNELDPGTLEDLHTQFRLEQVAEFPAFDDVDRNVLILYKLHPLPLSQQTLEDEQSGSEESGSAKVAGDKLWPSAEENTQ